MNHETERIAALFHDGKYDEIAALGPSEGPWDEPISGVYCLAAHYLNKMPLTREGLADTWQSIKTLLLQQVQGDGEAPLPLVQTSQELLTLCATSLYRACNDRLKLEYAMLQKDVSFEKKEYVIDRMRELLLGADINFTAIVEVLEDCAATVTQTTELCGASEEFFLGYLRVLQNAAQIAEDNSLLERFPPVRLARRACGLPLREDMTEALEKRNALLALTLQGDDALKDWAYFAPYAEKAGISREALEKAQRKRKRVERLKFWKKKK